MFASTAEAEVTADSGRQIEAWKSDVEGKESESKAGLFDRRFETDTRKFDGRNLDLEAGKIKLQGKSW